MLLENWRLHSNRLYETSLCRCVCVCVYIFTVYILSLDHLVKLMCFPIYVLTRGNRNQMTSKLKAEMQLFLRGNNKIRVWQNK